MKLTFLKKDYYIVLAGDFNARTDVLHDFINYDNCNLAPGGISPPTTMIRPRKSFDTHVYDLGKQLPEMCKSLDLRILNGRCNFSLLPKVTRLNKLPSTEIKALVRLTILFSAMKFCTFSKLWQFVSHHLFQVIANKLLA